MSSRHNQLVVVLAACVYLMEAPSARAFVLLDFRTAGDLALSKWFDWFNPRTSVARCPGGRGSPFTLTYAIDSAFMSNQTPEVRAGAAQAIRNALATWSGATNGLVTFQPADWAAVVNADGTTRIFFDGPSVAQWQPCQNTCSTCWPNSPCPNVLPGWGANIDFFTRPINWTLTSNGFTYRMTDQILAFAAIHRSSDGIFSVDIYLNSSRLWTNSATAARVPFGMKQLICPCPLHAGRDASDATLSPADASTIQGGVAYDIETVVLHELGHALGLDHPNEACTRNAVVLDPFTYQQRPCADVDPNAVMAGFYNGVKRTLTDDDIGGVSFLYRSRLAGDLDADDAVTLLDAVYALDLAGHAQPATPFEVNVMDFKSRNGRIDMDEAAQVFSWALIPGSGPPLSLDKQPDIVNASPSTIALSGTFNPADAGLASTLALTIRADNPQSIPITAWDIDVAYNTSILSNPRISSGTLLAQGVWLAANPAAGVLRFSKVGIASSDNAVFGSLGTITFDVNLAAAGAGPASLSFPLSDIQIVVINPDIHNFGSVPANMETLVVQNPSVPSFRYDADASGILNIADLYEFFSMPYDVNKDAAINATDRTILRNAIRSPESSDVLIP